MDLDSVAAHRRRARSLSPGRRPRTSPRLPLPNPRLASETQQITPACRWIDNLRAPPAGRPDHFEQLVDLDEVVREDRLAVAVVVLPHRQVSLVERAEYLGEV